MRQQILIGLFAAVAGCSSGGLVPSTARPPEQYANSVQPGPRDAGEAPDLAQRTDLAAPPDLGQQPDLASPPDMARAPDLAEQPDLGKVPDLATAPHDMTPPTGCMVVLKPAATLPVTLGPGVYRYELGEVPRPELGVDVLVQFVRTDRLFTGYSLTIEDASCSTKCPEWRHEGNGARAFTYRWHSTAGWRRPKLTVEVAGAGTTVELQVVELTGSCK